MNYSENILIVLIKRMTREKPVFQCISFHKDKSKRKSFTEEPIFIYTEKLPLKKMTLHVSV